MVVAPRSATGIRRTPTLLDRAIVERVRPAARGCSRIPTPRSLRRRRLALVHALRGAQHGPPGLLHTITVGFASAGVDVHSARVETVEGQAVDRFELTDRNGRKLDESARRAVVEATAGGARTGRGVKLLRRR